MNDGFLGKAYAARDADGTRTLYDEWAATYEAELTQNGYATPGRCAADLATQMEDLAGPILDFGCGTGLSGVALQAVGFSVIDGVDLSADMLEGAKLKGIYRNLRQIEADEALDLSGYTAVTAIGVIGAGAAPIQVFDILMEGLDSDAYCVLSFNDHALEDPKNEARINAWVESGRARLLSKTYGDHIPGIGIGSNVYVLQKT